MDLERARQVLEEDHYGMDDVKKRILVRRGVSIASRRFGFIHGHFVLEVFVKISLPSSQHGYCCQICHTTVDIN